MPTHQLYVLINSGRGSDKYNETLSPFLDSRRQAGRLTCRERLPRPFDPFGSVAKSKAGTSSSRRSLRRWREVVMGTFCYECGVNIMLSKQCNRRLKICQTGRDLLSQRYVCNSLHNGFSCSELRFAGTTVTRHSGPHCQSDMYQNIIGRYALTIIRASLVACTLLKGTQPQKGCRRLVLNIAEDNAGKRLRELSCEHAA